MKLGLGNKRSTERRLPHTPFYCTSAVSKALKRIAVETDCKVHDLLVGGVVMARHGQDFDLLNHRR